MLLFWKTGEYINPHKTSSHFSVENWGDRAISVSSTSDERKLNRRATKYVPTVQKWDQERWDELKQAASEFVEVSSRKRAASSRSASEVDDVMLSDEEVIIVSD